MHFKEFLRFKNIPLPEKILPIKATPEIQNALQQYLTWGGFPKIVLTDSEEQKSRLLKQYFEDILFKDIVMRHSVRDVVTLRNLAVYLYSQTACLIGFKRLANQFAVSQQLIQHYCQYLHEAYLIELLPYYSLKVSERARNPGKIHVLDPGIRKVLSLSPNVDMGRTMESVVYQHMRNNHHELFYWKGKQEIDLLKAQGGQPVECIQSAWNVNDDDTRQRELLAMDEALKKFAKVPVKLVVNEIPSAILGEIYHVEPLWYSLLQSDTAV